MTQREPDMEGFESFLAMKQRQASTQQPIGDRTEVARVGDRFGLSSEAVRNELAKRGWHREESPHGLIFWYPKGREPDRKRRLT